MLLGRLRIRGKLTLLVAIPLLAALGLTVPAVADRVRQSDQASSLARDSGVANQVGILLQDVQQERLLSVAYLLGLVDRGTLVRQTADVDDQVSEVEATQAGALPAVTIKALRGMGALNPVRAAVLAHRTTPDQAIAAFSAAVTGAIDSLQLMNKADLGTPTGRRIYALDLVLRLNEDINLGGVELTYAAASGAQQAVLQFSLAYLDTQRLSTTFGQYAAPAEGALYGRVLDALTARVGPDFLAALQGNPAAVLGRIGGPQALEATLAANNVGRFVEQKLTADVIADLRTQQQTQTRIAYLAVCLALLLLLLTALMSVAIARSVARPLTRLTRSAERVARVAEDELVRIADDESELPRPVRLDAVNTGGRDEIGELARAFERVQATAAGLVERQVASRRNVAQMFGHVGRRTQNLVGRQLGLIDRLERAEADPGRLSDLYRLDHVSNRLLRNASSLVVLSGGTGGADHVVPLPLGDVVRLALGEIEDYTRVQVDMPPTLFVVPAVISDLVLVFAELMENATAFSPPHTAVTVQAAMAGRGVRVSIVDHGIGISPERLSEENARLARRERLDLAPTEVLGLFVVGRLARRHGLSVVLDQTPGGGVTTLLDLPDTVISRIPSTPVLMLNAGARATGGAPVVIPPAGFGESRGTWPAASRVGGAEMAGGQEVFNITTLQESLDTGQPWNAFVPRHPAPPMAPAPVVAPAPPVTPAPPPPAAPTAVPPPAPTAVPAPTPAAAGPPLGTLPRRPTGGPLAVPLPPRRVPGATLNGFMPPGTARAEPVLPPDPEAVRAAVQQFEFGVARAMRETEQDPPDHGGVPQ